MLKFISIKVKMRFKLYWQHSHYSTIIFQKFIIIRPFQSCSSPNLRQRWNEILCGMDKYQGSRCRIVHKCRNRNMKTCQEGSKRVRDCRGRGARSGLTMKMGILLKQEIYVRPTSMYHHLLFNSLPTAGTLKQSFYIRDLQRMYALKLLHIKLYYKA